MARGGGSGRLRIHLTLAGSTGSWNKTDQAVVETSCLHLRHHPAQSGQHYGVGAAALELIQLVIN